jgi:hypothetical protein
VVPAARLSGSSAKDLECEVAWRFALEQKESRAAE